MCRLQPASVYSKRGGNDNYRKIHETMKRTIPWIALIIGLFFSLVLVWNASDNSSSQYQLPLLTLLLMCEFGSLINLISAGIGVRHLIRQGFNKLDLLFLIGNLMLAMNLLLQGLKLWQGLNSG